MVFGFRVDSARFMALRSNGLALANRSAFATEPPLNGGTATLFRAFVHRAFQAVQPYSARCSNGQVSNRLASGVPVAKRCLARLTGRFRCGPYPGTGLYASVVTPHHIGAGS
jgi:hypothetical protein